MDDNKVVIPDFTRDEYLSTSTPYEWVYQFHNNPFQMNQILIMLKDKAQLAGVKNFAKLYKAYENMIQSRDGLVLDNTTDFQGQKMELKCGDWTADEFGISTTDKYGFEIVACNHPIYPSMRLVNIDTGVEKLKIEYRKGKAWKSIIVDKQTLASNNSILQLANYGVAVNSENSKHLVRYITDIENLNYDVMPEVNAVSRLGWIDGYGFSPYVDNLVFDGDLSYKTFFESVKPRGSYDVWMNEVRKIRQGNIYARIMLASAFASVLVSPCDCLPFFVHLWGGTESGKTVGLMLAASVWANPEIGRYIHTFNSTAVAQELSAGFVNSMPLIIDELQIVKDKKNFDDTIYQLTEGVGKNRGQKTGGLQKLPTWRNCIMTTGEYPIGTLSSGGGAMNRIIEIDCKDVKLFDDPVKLVSTLRKNHGFAGKIFVEKLSDEENLKRAIDLQREIYKEVTLKDTTDKQATSASLILTADALIDEWMFHDGIRLTVDDLTPMLQSKSDVSQNRRALEFIYDYIAINSAKFTPDRLGEYVGDIYGKIDERAGRIYIIKAHFEKLMQDNGYNAKAFMSWAKAQDILVPQGKNNTYVVKFGKSACRCVAIKLLSTAETSKNNEDMSFLDEDEDEDLPY